MVLNQVVEGRLGNAALGYTTDGCMRQLLVIKVINVTKLQAEELYLGVGQTWTFNWPGPKFCK